MYNLFGSGVRTWVLQRLSALYLALYLVGLIIYLNANPIENYLTWRLFLSNFWFQISTIIFLISIFYHSWVGIRDVLLDYLSNKTTKLFALTALMAVIIAGLIWGIYIVV